MEKLKITAKLNVHTKREHRRLFKYVIYASWKDTW